MTAQEFPPENLNFTIDHYENFPVGSMLLPSKLRKPIRQIYHFARFADDIADEGSSDATHRFKLLSDFKNNFHQHVKDSNLNNNQAFRDLAITISTHQLPLKLFDDLLSAFEQDIFKNRYENFEELLHYCKKSANPIGQLLLHLTSNDTKENLILSNKVCSSLQIINFLQDIHLDYANNNRIYMPQQELRAFGVSERNIGNRTINNKWKNFIFFQIKRAKELLDEGSQLCSNVEGRFGLELKVIVTAGDFVLSRLSEVQGDIFNRRPTIRPIDWPKIMLKAWLK